MIDKGCTTCWIVKSIVLLFHKKEYFFKKNILINTQLIKYGLTL